MRVFSFIEVCTYKVTFEKYFLAAVNGKFMYCGNFVKMFVITNLSPICSVK